MLDAVRSVLEQQPRVAYGLVFGSIACGQSRADSDVDIAIGLMNGPASTHRPTLSAHEMGSLVSLLEQATQRDVDLVVLSQAPIPLAFRIFEEGRDVFVRERSILVADKARAIVDWLYFKPIHDLCVAGALKAASRG